MRIVSHQDAAVAVNVAKAAVKEGPGNQPGLLS
jgi:hypothetical protein